MCLNAINYSIKYHGITFRDKLNKAVEPFERPDHLSLRNCSRLLAPLQRHFPFLMCLNTIGYSVKYNGIALRNKLNKAVRVA